MRIRQIIYLVVLLWLLNSRTVMAEPPRAPADVPFYLVNDSIASFSLVNTQNKIFFHRPYGQPCQPGYAENVSRIAASGGPQRILYVQKNCNPSIKSNIVADDNYVYWVGVNGLVRLSVNTNPGDAPELVNGLFTGNAELAIDATHIFVLEYDNNNYATLYRVVKASGARVWVAGAGYNAGNLQVSYSFISLTERYYAYWLDGTNLQRVDLNTSSVATIAATNISGYDAEGKRTFCANNFCTSSDIVFFARGAQVYVYNNLTGGVSGSVYTSTDPSAQVLSLTADSNNLFLLERRSNNSCLPFACYNYPLIRTGRSSDVNQTIIYNTQPLTGLVGPNKLTTDGTYLYWQSMTSALMRLPNNAAALPQINLQITGLEITQGIQNTTNRVFLVKNRRTFVRAYVKSDWLNVNNVRAQLTATWNGGATDVPLSASNSPRGLNGYLTVTSAPNRDNLNDSFLFELPLDWTLKTNLVLTVEVNPHRYQLEPTYIDNVMQIGPLTFVDSPRLTVNLVQFQYMIGNISYTVPMSDTLAVGSTVRRLFPLASTPGWDTNPTPGFRPRAWTLFDAGLGSRVDYSASECNGYIQTVNGKQVDDRNQCATAYANNRLKAFRAEQGLDSQTFLYGLIPAAGKFVPRGLAWPGDRVSSGVSFNSSTAAHEIAHTLGRNHPFKGSADDTNVCGNSTRDGAYDMNYPYTNSAIGPVDKSYAGFDIGDPVLNIGPAVYPSDQWTDLLGYCPQRWVSDYTYRAIYKYFFPSAAVAPIRVSTPRVNGDWLTAFGMIDTNNTRGFFSHTRRVSSVAEVIPSRVGGYRLRLRDLQGNTLADYDLAPQDLGDGGGMMGFAIVAQFIVGTRELQLIKGTSQVIANRYVSSNPPTINNVALQGAPNPVSGFVTLGWNASDPDGDALTFDIFYSRDGGVSFQPLKFGISSTSTSINTNTLGGSGLFRIIATDGVQSTQANSPTYTMVNKPPIPRIYSPGNGTQISWGQLLTFSGDADDLQDGTVADSGLVWSDQLGNVLGIGAIFSKTDLRVGTNIITLTATNSAGLSASTSIAVIVDDDLRFPGPILSLGPSQVNWHIAPGTTALQTSQIIINNAGGGTLNWTASSNQAWLTLGVGAGSTPFTLTLTANPAGMTDGTTRTANVTITKPANGEPAQTIVVPVNLSMGRVFNPITLYTERLYLPFVRR